MKISIVIPIYRESSECLDQLDSWINANKIPSCEWIIALADDENSIDAFKKSTLSKPFNIMTSKQTQYKVSLSQTGRARQLNQASKLAVGTVLLFLHADTILEEGWQNHFDDLSSFNWGCFTPKIKANGTLFRMAEGWGLWRSRIFGIPYGDQCIFVKKNLFDIIGGYDEKTQFMEDLELSKTLNRKYGKPAIMSSKAITSNRLWTNSKELKKQAPIIQSIKNLSVFLGFLIGIPREQLKTWYHQ